MGEAVVAQAVVALVSGAVVKASLRRSAGTLVVTCAARRACAMRAPLRESRLVRLPPLRARAVRLRALPRLEGSARGRGWFLRLCVLPGFTWGFSCLLYCMMYDGGFGCVCSWGFMWVELVGVQPASIFDQQLQRKKNQYTELM